MYIIYAKDMFELEEEGGKENLGHLYEMANRSMFRKESPIILGNNMDSVLSYSFNIR